MSEPLYIDFSQYESQSHKKMKILEQLVLASSAEYINDLLETKALLILESRGYKDSIGCPVLYLSYDLKPIEEKKRAQCFRELNGKFPLTKLSNTISQIYKTGEHVAI